MKAIILAAGLGTRLRPITNEVPKCMVPVNGIRIIDKQIDNLRKAGVQDIVIVGGYKSDILKKHLSKYEGITFIDNSRYAETNNMYSLYLALPHIGDSDFILMNADVYYDANIISGLLKSEYSSKSMIACDRNGYIEESMKVTLDPNNHINHISKKITEGEYYAVSIDVYKLTHEACSILYKEVKETIEGRKDENSWTEVALDSIFDKTTFLPYIIEGRWFEIDNHEDLHKAEELFKEDIL